MSAQQTHLSNLSNLSALKGFVRQNGGGHPAPSISSFRFERGYKRYEVANHLGNVLAVCSDRKIVATQSADKTLFESYLADLYAIQDVHPFGMPKPERSREAEEVRFAFNGKETDREWNTLDYGARMYRPAFCRFLSGRSPDRLQPTIRGVK